MITYPGTFFGLAPPDSQAAAVILPLPFEQTVSYGIGTSTGPRAIIEASAELEIYDEEFDIDYSRVGGLLTASPILPDRQWNAE